MKEKLQRKQIHTDVLIVGGGTAGCYAALTLSRKSGLSVLIAEKANIKRSGCLAAGVNAINAYIVKGRKPQDYVDYATNDANGIVRKDLLLTAAEHFNEVTAEMEKLGLVILKDENGDYVARGNRNIKINGENFKPILADAVNQAERIDVLNNVNITDLLVDNDKVYGAVGFSIKENTAYEIHAGAVLIATSVAVISLALMLLPPSACAFRRRQVIPPVRSMEAFAFACSVMSRHVNCWSAWKILSDVAEMYRSRQVMGPHITGPSAVTRTSPSLYAPSFRISVPVPLLWNVSMGGAFSSMLNGVSEEMSAKCFMLTRSVPFLLT